MRLSELAFFTDDVDSLAEFYEHLLDVAPVHRDDGIAVFQMAGLQILIHKTYQPGPRELPCENHVAFAVDDVEAAVAECESRGLLIEVPPCDYDWGRSAYLRAPDGQLIELAVKRSSQKSAPAGCG